MNDLDSVKVNRQTDMHDQPIALSGRYNQELHGAALQMQTQSAAETCQYMPAHHQSTP